MVIKFSDIIDAFEFVSFGQMYEHQAILDTESGKIYLHSDFGDDEEALPNDIDDEKYIEIPHKNELDLGQKLVFNFVYEYLPKEAETIEAIFRRKGAYSKFKDILERKGALESWYEFESKMQEKEIREWCKDHSIQLIG